MAETWFEDLFINDVKGALAGGSGTSGTDGREVEFQATSTAIQWRYVGESDWTDLIALSAIKGDKGDTGADGATGAQGPKGDKGDAGADGRGITSCELNDSGELVITYTDGTSTNLGVIGS